MAVTSRPLTEETKRKRLDVNTAPLRADDLDTAGALLRWLIGVGMVGYSIVTTAMIFSRFLAPVITSGIAVVAVTISWGFIIGFIFGVIVTAIEWVTTKRAPAAHWAVVLLLDAPFSAVQTALWLFVIAHVYEASTPWYIGIGVLSALWGIFVAKLGEWLLITKKA